MFSNKEQPENCLPCSKEDSTQQDFYKLRSECLEKGILFEDPEFNVSKLTEDLNKILNGESEEDLFNVEWKRPKEVCDNPQFFVDGPSRFDIIQEYVGDCWLLATIDNLTLHKDLFYHVVPEGQGFSNNYAGIFHFRFWVYGHWVDTVIDDRLPYNDGKPLSVHSRKQNEFWIMLLEKAYAKFHGSYEAIIGGYPEAVMEDFTGGITETYRLDRETPKDMDQLLLQAYKRNALMVCDTWFVRYPKESELTSQNLMKGHSYSITKIEYIKKITKKTKKEENVLLLRIRNPWGNETEWKGPWSDKSTKWESVPEEVKKEIEWNIKPDGEFWMSYSDFITNFEFVHICNLIKDSLFVIDDKLVDKRNKNWVSNTIEGKWVDGITTGGCNKISNFDIFWLNPQYKITLSSPDEGDEDDLCTVLIALTNKIKKSKGKEGHSINSVGFEVYKLEDSEDTPKPLDKDFFRYHDTEKFSAYSSTRKVSDHFKLNPGIYCIVPFSYYNETGEFLLRVFSERKCNLEDYDGESVKLIVNKENEDANKTEKEKEKLDINGAHDEEELRKKLQRKIDNHFKALRKASDKKVMKKELINILHAIIEKEIVKEGFSKDLSCIIVKSEVYNNGKELSSDKMKQLLFQIADSMIIFRRYQDEETKMLSSHYIQAGLLEIGYHVNKRTLINLVNCYSSESKISLENFIICVVQLNIMINRK
ncbi:calpain-B-like isoform X2 [Lycorma delicatula]|uniref:calpain-B-like isoform X2 n=1 Tax=Lycorma delicatula TaxID=130591 RepID=UPI003F5113D3